MADLTPLDHPWLNDADTLPSHRDSVRVAMKNAMAMLEHADPPDWILVLDVWGLFHHSRTRIVLADDATIDFEAHVGEPPLTTVLTERQTQKINDVLAGCTPDSIFDLNNPFLDGSPCVVAVINGRQRWCRFAEFNLDGLSDDDLRCCGPALATCLRTLAATIAK
jgi:hypothetical protein